MEISTILEPTQLSRRLRRLAGEYAPVAIAATSGLLLSLGLASSMKRQLDAVARYDFSEESKTCIGVFEKSLHASIDLVRWTGAAFSAVPNLGRSPFEAIARDVLVGGNASVALQWAPRIHAEDRAGFEARARGEGWANFTIREFDGEGLLKPAGDRATYFPLLYSAPDAPGRELHGLDLHSDPVLRRYIDLAIEKNTPFFVSEAPSLARVSGGRAILVLAPVFRPLPPETNAGDRRKSLLGLAAGIIHLDQLANTALEELKQAEIDIHVFDFFAEPGRQLLYYRPGQSQHRKQPYISDARVQLLSDLHYVGAISLGTTRRWLVACTPSPGYAFGIQSWSPLIGLALGLLVTAAATYHFYANIRQRRAAEELVLRRTAELKRTNNRLRREVNERKRFEQEREGLLDLLESSNARLARSNQDLQDFALVASHDLKEPLRKVRALAGNLRERLAARLDEGAAEYLDVMDDVLKRMQNLITSLLEISRVATHGRPFEAVNLGDIAAEVVSDLAVRIEETGGEIAIGALPTVHADPMQMRQFMQNILENSLKYHRKGVPPRVEVVARQHANGILSGGNGAGPYAIEFRDNGVGIPSELSEHAFTLFQRLDNGARIEGSGVGLAVCRKIAERHGGSLTVQSETGSGSTFILTLPGRHDSIENGAGESHEYPPAHTAG